MPTSNPSDLGVKFNRLYLENKGENGIGRENASVFFVVLAPFVEHFISFSEFKRDLSKCRDNLTRMKFFEEVYDTPSFLISQDILGRVKIG